LLFNFPLNKSIYYTVSFLHRCDFNNFLYLCLEIVTVTFLRWWSGLEISTLAPRLTLRCVSSMRKPNGYYPSHNWSWRCRAGDAPSRAEDQAGTQQDGPKRDHPPLPSRSSHNVRCAPRHTKASYIGLNYLPRRLAAATEQTDSALERAWTLRIGFQCARSIPLTIVNLGRNRPFIAPVIKACVFRVDID